MVSIQTGEVVFFWELPARAATKLKRQLQEDLATLDGGDFLAAWSGQDAGGDGTG